jgi:hypothetical protein
MMRRPLRNSTTGRETGGGWWICVFLSSIVRRVFLTGGSSWQLLLSVVAFLVLLNLSWMGSIGENKSTLRKQEQGFTPTMSTTTTTMTTSGSRSDNTSGGTNEDDDSSSTTIPHRLIFTYRTNILQTKQPPMHYQNVMNTIQIYQQAGVTLLYICLHVSSLGARVLIYTQRLCHYVFNNQSCMIPNSSLIGDTGSHIIDTRKLIRDNSCL